MNKKIIIIGAGASGIAAGTKLLEFGYRNLVILEAENRIGGRINTIPFAANVVDMGAQWCHGEVNNVVYEMGAKYKLFDSTKAKYDTSLFIKSDGSVLNHEIGDKLMGLVISIVETFKDEMSTFRGSLGNFIVDKYTKAIQSPEYTDIDPDLGTAFLEFYQKYENSIEASDTLFDASCTGYCHYWDCDGDRLLNWKDKGYKTLFDILTKKISDQKQLPIENFIQFNRIVKKINWKSDEQKDGTSITIECQDGKIIDGDHVICTMSLGVLKEQCSTMFHPQLPIRKLNAIEGLTLGTVDKIYVEFEKAFWPDNWRGFSLLWHQNDLDTVRSSDNNWLEDLFGFYTVDYQPNILCGWIYGVNARRMELIPIDIVRKVVIDVLRKFLSKEFLVPDPIRIERSTWYSNPNFRGSYSYRSIKTDLLNTSASDLAIPVTNSLGKPILQFAGEATHDHYYSTVHGAVESGWREANRIIDLYKIKSQL